MDLFYKQYGKEGPPLLILHGVFGMLDNWHSLSKKLSEQYSVYAIDLRNHGHSPHSSEMSYEAMAEDVYELIQKLELPSVVLLGHSMGGKVAMQFAATYPGQLSHLIIADIAPKRYRPGHLEIINALKGLDFETISTRREAEEQLSKSIDQPGVMHFLLKNLQRKEDGKYGLKMNLEAIEQQYQHIIGSITFDWPIDIPTLFLKGENSRYIRKEDEASIAHWFTDVQFETVSKAGHWLHADNPSEFLQKTTHFLQESH